MGLTRKLLSVSTLGAVDMRSDKERAAAYTKASKKQAKRQTALMEQQARATQRAAEAQEAAARQRQVTTRSSVADELTKLAALRESGALTEAEFEAQKARLLR